MIKTDSFKKGYISAFLCNDRYIKDMIILNTKSLVDNKVDRNVYVDYKRLRSELIYYKFYGDRLTNLNILNILIPIIISNTNIDKSESEVIKNIIYHTKVNKLESYLYEYIIGASMYNSLIHNIMNNKNIEYVELLTNIKQRIIELKVELEKTEIVKFEMKRIKSIQYIDKYIDNEIDEYKEEDIVKNLLMTINQVYIEDKEIEVEGINSIKKSILSMLDFDMNQSIINNIDFIESLANYIIKLKEYKVNKKEFDTKADPRNLIPLNIGDTYSDPILNTIKVIDRRFENNILNINIISKSGNYVFKFKKS